MTQQRNPFAAELMMAFAERTGVRGGGPMRRYLWTDAFAVCNFLGLAEATHEPIYGDLALELIQQVHQTLGRHGTDDRRHGWLSGLGDSEGETHPTRGGLRIGKSLPERQPDEPLDDRSEWDRDGQYFHYLSKWMHALDQAARMTGHARFNFWARELADTAFNAFVYSPTAAAAPRMYWKMSVDLRRPLVPSMGQHDPIDGYITCRELQTTARILPWHESAPDLGDQLSVWMAMLTPEQWPTADTLGLGGLLVDAYRLDQLATRKTDTDDALRGQLLAAAIPGLEHFARSHERQQGAQHRLGFRELGLAIGLQALQAMVQSRPRGDDDGPLHTLQQFVPLGAEIESFWRDPDHRRVQSWLEHQDINDVMLATCLMPAGFLTLAPPVHRP